MTHFALEIPPDLLARLTARATRERWLLRSLMLQLLEDYAEGRVTPSAPAPANPIRDQYRLLFGAAYDELKEAPDWLLVTDRERGQRLREAMVTEDLKFGRPSRFSADFDFVLVAQRLGFPDVGNVGFINRCPKGHASGLEFTPDEIRRGLEQNSAMLWCQRCGESRAPTPAQREELEAALKRAAKRRP